MFKSAVVIIKAIPQDERTKRWIKPQTDGVTTVYMKWNTLYIADL